MAESQREAPIAGRPHRALGSPAVIVLPVEIDISNSAEVAVRLRAAFGSGSAVVVADLTATSFCDTSGARALLLTHLQAAADGAELRLTLAPGPVLRLLELLGYARHLLIYPAVDAAISAPPRTCGTGSTAAVTSA